MITKINLLAIIFIVLCLTLSFAGISQSAVDSSGEVNAKDNNAGTLIAGTQADLILFIIIDMSAMEPGEEIESISITVPNGLAVKGKPVKSVVIGGENIPDFTQQIQDNNQIIIKLPTLIRITSKIAIEFTVDASAVPIPELQFVVGLMAINQRSLIASIKPGNADGRVNNDSLTLRSVSATKPLPPANLKVQPDPNGENDLIITWSKVEEIGGYLIYRNDKGNTEIANVIGKDQTSYTDRDLKPGSYTYTIRSYKNQALRSDLSASASGIATVDKKAPIPPQELKILDKDKEIEISWKPSPSPDVVEYIIYRELLPGSAIKLSELSATRNSYSYIDAQPPESGSFLYIVGAADEAGNEAKSSSPTQTRQIGDKPYPNPFTPKYGMPKSGNLDFSQVTFKSSLVKGGEGTFTVKIFDLDGNLVIEKTADSGSKEIKWDGKDSSGKLVNSGIYIYQANMGNKYKVGSIIVAK